MSTREMKGNLSLPCDHRSPVESLCVLLTDKNMCSQFSDIQIYSPVQEQLRIAGDLAAGIVQPLTKNTQMTVTAAARKNALWLHVFDSWLRLRCHIPLTPHVPVSVAIKTKTLPRSGCPPCPFPKNSIKTKQRAVTAHYSHCRSPTGINHLV